MPQEPIFFLGYCAHELEHMFEMSGFTLSEATYSLFNTSNIQIDAILQWNLCAAWVRRSQPTRYIYHYRWFLSGQPEVKVHFFCGIFSDGPRAKAFTFSLRCLSWEVMLWETWPSAWRLQFVFNSHPGMTIPININWLMDRLEPATSLLMFYSCNLSLRLISVLVDQCLGCSRSGPQMSQMWSVFVMPTMFLLDTSSTYPV